MTYKLSFELYEVLKLKINNLYLINTVFFIIHIL